MNVLMLIISVFMLNTIENKEVTYVAQLDTIEVVGISQIKFECLEEIKKHEDLKLTTYLDPNGTQLAIGYGHMTTEYTTITQEQANKYLEEDFDKRIRIVTKRNPNLSYNKRLALAMAMYNLTWKSYLKIERSPHKWTQFCNYKDKHGIQHRSTGLYKRRLFEKKIWDL